MLYVNADLLAKAGVDVSALPKTWPELLALGKTIEAKAGTAVTGLYYQWEQTGNWLFQSLVTSKSGRILKADGCSIAFDDANGMWALKTLEAFGRSGMPNLGLGQARQSFVAGNIAISADSSFYVAAAERQIGGRFQFKTVAFPLAVADGRLPAVFAKDAERQKAAWKYVKFTTSSVGQTAMVNATGYMPGNEIAVKTPDLLGTFYARSPNHLTSIQQLPLLTEWASFPGDNSLKIIEVIKHHIERLVTGKRTAEQACRSWLELCPIFFQSAAASDRTKGRDPIGQSRLRPWPPRLVVTGAAAISWRVFRPRRRSRRRKWFFSIARSAPSSLV